MDEVIGIFATLADLEVVLLTEDGTKRTRIRRIITAWDVAPCPPIEKAPPREVSAANRSGAHREGFGRGTGRP
jgi:hypothetical protein